MIKKVGIVCGGYSGEAEISMRSASMLMNHIDKTKYEPVQIVISRDSWHAITKGGKVEIDRNDFSYILNNRKQRPDICLITIHGTPGEDGKLQGYFDLINMPYTTGSVLNTALTFNKIFTTRVLRQMGFKTAAGELITKPSDYQEEKLLKSLRLPLFVKPNEGGSSLGASLVREISELQPAVLKAFELGKGVLIEEYIGGREFSCGVIATALGAKALHITEIATQKAFFDYAAKYDYDQTEEITPAQLPADQYRACQEMTEKIFNAFQCRGVARIDYKLFNDEFYVIEINTTPGMTDASIVPQQAAAMGIDKTQLITMILGDYY